MYEILPVVFTNAMESTDSQPMCCSHGQFVRLPHNSNSSKLFEWKRFCQLPNGLVIMDISLLRQCGSYVAFDLVFRFTKAHIIRLRDKQQNRVTNY